MSNILKDLLKKKSVIQPPVQIAPNVQVVSLPPAYIPPPTKPQITYKVASVEETI